MQNNNTPTHTFKSMAETTEYEDKVHSFVNLSSLIAQGFAEYYKLKRQDKKFEKDDLEIFKKSIERYNKFLQDILDE